MHKKYFIKIYNRVFYFTITLTIHTTHILFLIYSYKEIILNIIKFLNPNINDKFYYNYILMKIHC